MAERWQWQWSNDQVQWFDIPPSCNPAEYRYVRCVELISTDGISEALVRLVECMTGSAFAIERFRKTAEECGVMVQPTAKKGVKAVDSGAADDGGTKRVRRRIRVDES